MGALFARLAAAALSAKGVLGLSNVASALGDALLLAAIVLVAATAAATSLLLNAHAKRAEQGSNLAAIVAIAVAGIGSAVSFCLAHHMEIASLARVVAKAAVAGILSSIIVGICLYLLGYKEPIRRVIFRELPEHFKDHVAGIFGATRAPFSFKKLAKQAARDMEDQTLVINGVNTAPALYTILIAADDDPMLAPFYPELSREVRRVSESAGRKAPLRLCRRASSFAL